MRSFAPTNSNFSHKLAILAANSAVALVQKKLNWLVSFVTHPYGGTG